jgi:hypothetical protein
MSCFLLIHIKSPSLLAPPPIFPNPFAHFTFPFFIFFFVSSFLGHLTFFYHLLFFHLLFPFFYYLLLFFFSSVRSSFYYIFHPATNKKSVYNRRQDRTCGLVRSIKSGSRSSSPRGANAILIEMFGTPQPNLWLTISWLKSSCLVYTLRCRC